MTKKNLRKQGKKEAYRHVTGMYDILPKDEVWWKAVWNAGQTVSELYDFSFIETPVLEPIRVCESSLGTLFENIEDVYTFVTQEGMKVALRPEGTAPILRSYLEHNLGYFSLPLKVYYHGPVFRREERQGEMYRQMHQWGFEVVGDADPLYDVHVLLTALHFLHVLKLKNLELEINTAGCRVCRSSYRHKLETYYKAHTGTLCEECAQSLLKNPIKLLLCSRAECIVIREGAPLILDYLCQSCNTALRSVLELLEDNSILYKLNPYLVRGEGYYNKTVFVIRGGLLKETLASGGRYDYLGEAIGARIIPSVGVALSVPHLIKAMQEHEDHSMYRKEVPRVFFVAIGDQAKRASLRLMRELRIAGVPVVEALTKKSLKSQLKVAEKLHIPLGLLFGQKEVFEESIIMRNLKTGAQEIVPLKSMVESVKKNLRDKHVVSVH